MNERSKEDGKPATQDPTESILGAATPIEESTVRRGGGVAIRAALPDMRPLQPPPLEVAIASMEGMHIVGLQTTNQ